MGMGRTRSIARMEALVIDSDEMYEDNICRTRKTFADNEKYVARKSIPDS